MDFPHGYNYTIYTLYGFVGYYCWKRMYGVWSSHDGYKSLSIDDPLCNLNHMRNWRTVEPPFWTSCHPMKKHHVDFQNPPFWRNSHLVNILGLISIFIYEIPINHPLLYHHFSVFFLGEKSPHFWWKIPSLGFPEQGFAVRGICHTSLASCLAGDEQVPGGNMCPCFVGYPMGYDYIYLYIYIYTIYLFI